MSGPRAGGGDHGAVPDGVTWRLVAVTDDAGRRPVPDGVVASLRLDGDHVALQGACNRGRGRVEVDGDVWRIGAMMTTRMACEPDRMALDDLVVAVLAASPVVRVDGGRLVLHGAGRTLELSATTSPG